MTISPSKSGRACPDGLRPALGGQAIELRWSAVGVGEDGLPHRLELVVSLQPVDDRHAILGAWLETPTGIHRVAARRLVECSGRLDGDLVHVDASLDGARLVAATLSAPESGRAGTPLYAQTTLLASAGLTPGAYDPPRGRFLTPESDAASA